MPAVGENIFNLSGVYDEAFFDGIDGVTNALDNVQARKLHHL